MPEIILPTKLFVPAFPEQAVRRPRLVRQLSEGLALGRRLTLVSAPAGYGKTTLLSEWLAAQTRRAAWLSLDSHDDTPMRFWRYLIAALQGTLHAADSQFGQATLHQLRAEQSDWLETTLNSLLAELAGVSQESILILEDYHLISHKSIHKGVAFLLAHLPWQHHLVICARADPPFPLSRFRGAAQMTEIRMADLRFTTEECSDFLNQFMALNLTHSDVQVLAARTEGWIVGLQLAALSLQGQPDRSAFIEAFSGSNRHILDYLGEEVLAGLPQATQQFLLKTSILESITAPLADVLLNENNSDGILTQLEATNRFLIALDEERRWYRYHHLFRDLLQTRLRRTLSQGEISRLYDTASAWCYQNGFAVQAINYALAGGDMERAATIVEQNTPALLTHGELATLLGWIKLLPEALVRERPWLCVEQGWSLAYGGALDSAKALLILAEQKMNAKDNRLSGQIAAQRAYIALGHGNFMGAFELANQAARLLPSDDYWVRTVVEWVRGYVFRIQGRLAESAQAFAEQVRLAESCDNIWAKMMGVHDLATVYRISGQLHRAAALVREALADARTRGMDKLGYIGRVQAGLAVILYEQNKLVAARDLLLTSIEKNRLWQNPNHAVYSQVHLARVLMAQGDFQSAQDALSQAQPLIGKTAVLPLLGILFETVQARFWLAVGQMQAVSAWVEGHPVNPAAGVEAAEMEWITHARFLVSSGKADQAAGLLNELALRMESAGRVSAWIEVKALQAVLFQKQGSPRQAFAALEAAFSKAAAEGFQRVFLNEGDEMRLLLKDFCAQSGTTAPYFKELLAEFAAEKNEGQLTEPSTPAAAAPYSLPELLSERELEVLRGLSEGLSYAQIAARLFVAAGTVKVHVHNIYGKLNTANRTQALAAARALGLL